MINGEDPFRAEYDVNDGSPPPAQPTAVAAARIVAVTRTLAASRWAETLAARIDQLQTLMAGVLDELATLRSIPEADPVEPGGLLTWSYSYASGGRKYRCAALRAENGAYYCTGARTPQRASWEELAAWLASHQVRDLCRVTATEAAWLASHQVRDLCRVTATEPVSGSATVDAEVTVAEK